MRKYTIIFLLLFICQCYADTTNQIRKESSNLAIEYPWLDITGGFGLIWLFQFNATVSPIKYIYIQPRFSSSIAANEFGITSGIQVRTNEKSIIRIGVGYSKGAFIGIGSAENNSWESQYLRLGLLMRRGNNYIYNPNINIILRDKRPLFSFNFTLGYSLFR